MVREVRFELTTSCSQSKRATGLRYTLTEHAFYLIFAILWQCECDNAKLPRAVS